MEDPSWTFRFMSDAREKFKFDELSASVTLLLGRLADDIYTTLTPLGTLYGATRGKAEQGNWQARANLCNASCLTRNEQVGGSSSLVGSVYMPYISRRILRAAPSRSRVGEARSRFRAVGWRVEPREVKHGTSGGRRMRREEFLERVGEQEEADPQEEAPVRVAFAAPGGALSGSEMRDIWRQFPSEFDHLFG